MKPMLILLLALGVTSASAEQAAKQGVKYAQMTCFKTGEQVSGMNKICYYDCVGSGTAITISAVSLCPLTIQR